jgi:phosphohistidine phosphatase SixA
VTTRRRFVVHAPPGLAGALVACGGRSPDSANNTAPPEDAARVAFKAMVGWVRDRTGLSEMDAFQFVSQAARAPIIQLVDLGTRCSCASRSVGFLYRRLQMPTRSIALVVVAALVAFPPVAYAQRAVLVVRHADRLDDSEDSPLSAAGKERAQRLAALLKDVGITAIYTSQFQRTMQTVEPLARALKISPVSLPTADQEGLIKRIRAQHRQDVVLIVGHQMSVPALLKLLGHSEDLTIAATEYDNLFIVVPTSGGRPNVLRLRY